MMTNFKTIAATMMLALAAAMLQAGDFQVVAAPSAANADSLKHFSIYCHDGFQGTLERVDVDGVPAFRFTLTDALSPSPNAQRVQLRLKVTEPIEAGTEYRLSFRYRSTSPTYFTFRCQQAVTPWETVTEHAAGGALSSTSWKKMEYCFTPYLSNDANGIWMPNFELGFIGKGNALYLADIRIEALD